MTEITEADLRSTLASAIEDARTAVINAMFDPLNVVEENTLAALARYGDLRAVAAAWDEHVLSCLECGEMICPCERMFGIEADAKRLIGEATSGD